MENAVPTQASPQGLAASVATKFAAIYFFFVLFQESAFGFRSVLVNEIAHRGLGIVGEIADESSGSGDRLLDWLSVPAYVVLASILTAVWAVLGRRHRDDRLAQEALRVVLRYGLGLMIVGYGFAKTYQFPEPSVLDLAEPLGRNPPMGLLWHFMGYSPPYALFGGILEIVGGFLMLFRRTTLLGTTVFAAVMLNVFVLNLCYDVPVKLFTFHCLVAAALLLAPDVRRLLDLFVFNRPTAPRELGPPVQYRGLRVGVLVVKWLVVGNLLGQEAIASWTTWSHLRRTPMALDGVWIASDPKGGAGSWIGLDVGPTPAGRYARLHALGQPDYTARIDDDGHGNLHLHRRRGATRHWRYHLDGGTLTIIEGSETVRLIRDVRYPLAQHPFHWIQERPRTP